jgi:hypothetical protein
MGKRKRTEKEIFDNYRNFCIEVRNRCLAPAQIKDVFNNYSSDTNRPGKRLRTMLTESYGITHNVPVDTFIHLNCITLVKDMRKPGSMKHSSKSLIQWTDGLVSDPLVKAVRCIEYVSDEDFKKGVLPTDVQIKLALIGEQVTDIPPVVLEMEVKPHKKTVENVSKWMQVAYNNSKDHPVPKNELYSITEQNPETNKYDKHDARGEKLTAHGRNITTVMQKKGFIDISNGMVKWLTNEPNDIMIWLVAASLSKKKVTATTKKTVVHVEEVVVDEKPAVKEPTNVEDVIIDHWKEKTTSESNIDDFIEKIRPIVESAVDKALEKRFGPIEGNLFEAAENCRLMVSIMKQNQNGGQTSEK